MPPLQYTIWSHYWNWDLVGSTGGPDWSRLMSMVVPSRSHSRFLIDQLDFGFKFPHVHPRVSADLIKPFVQPSTCMLRPGEVDIPLVGDASRPIQQLVARAPARGRPPFSGRRSYQYKIRFKALDSHYDVWLTEKMLRTKHPELAPDLIAACDAQYQSTGVPGRA
jgi:hypothetical protein